ncbi:sugar nucleotide-binding protein, partial [Priestia megaterium]|uniref:sugar nucleotide-binding protein n=1 Tax=Priestia megaterium TaxID=1404 RepID=UPI0035B5BC85
MSLTILQFGATGQLAREVLARGAAGVEGVALARGDVDLADADAVARAVGEAGKVDLVLNAAA